MTDLATPRRPAGAGRARASSRGRGVLRLRVPAWLDGPLTSFHLVMGAGGLLLAIGLVMVFSASSMKAALAHEAAWKPGVQQVIWAGIGLVAMALALRLPIGLIRRWAPIALIGVAFLLLLVLVPGVGVELNGARGWLRVGGLSLQPLEVAKLVFALWGAHVLALRERYLTTRSLLVPVLPVFAVLSLLVLLEPDFNGVVCLFLVLAGLLWAGGAGWKIWTTLLGVAVVGFTGLITLAPYRAARITSFLDPFADPSNSGFQAIRGMYALASGGLWGVGLGNSRMKWDLLPHAESDYIFAIIGEELGFLGCLVVVVLYGVLAWAGFRIARRSADRFVQLASVAITVWLVGQAAMNMGYVVGVLPVTGVTLPLISAGGTSLVLTLFIIGLLARFARAEPEAIAALRDLERGRLARLLLPVPAQAVDPVRPRRDLQRGRRPGDGRPRGADRRKAPLRQAGRRSRLPMADEPRRRGAR